MLNEIALKLFTIHKLKGVGPATLKKLLAFPDFSTATLDELASRDNKLAKALESHCAYADATRSVEIDIDSAVKHKARIISLLDVDYPDLLRMTPDCPPFLYLRGSLAKSPAKSIAIIGTRNPTAHGVIIAERITDFFVDNVWSIVSGLAIGCDTIAHERALMKGGHTIAVLAHGLQTIAPKQNEKLASRILDNGGALLTEYAFGVDPIPPLFVKRDRIQAGLSRGVVMLQSDIDGGSMHASRASVEYGRILGVPYPTVKDDDNKEKKIGANILLCNGTQEQKCTLLKCSEDKLSLIQPIKGKEGYSNFELRLLS